MEAQERTDNPPQSLDQENMENTERANFTPTSDTEINTEEEDEVLLKTEDEWSEELQTPSPTIHQDTLLTHDTNCEEEEEESAGGWFLCHPLVQQDRAEEAEPQEEDTGLSEEEEEACGMCSPEELLQETVERLKTVMETDRWRQRQTGESKREELLEAADQVGDSIHHLVDAVRTDTH